MLKGSGWKLKLHLKSYSFFDFDNTLYKGQSRYLILDFSTYLEANNKFNKEDYLTIHTLFKTYFNGQIDRDQFAIQVVQTYYHGLSGHQISEIDEFAQDYWNNFNEDGWFPYTDPLLDLIKTFTIPILISGSPLEVLKLSEKLSGFKNIFASIGVVNSGVYTGDMELEMATEAAKKAMMTEFTKINKVDTQLSFAFGDSSSDFPMLNAVDPQNAYLLGANISLINEVRDKKWNHLGQDLRLISHVQKRINLLNSKCKISTTY
jgi:phosphoserine phosphatase